MIKNCINCLHSELVVEEGDSYKFLDPYGDEVARVHQQTILLCRAMPPITGSWPHVAVDDWCGYFETDSVSS